MPTDRTARAVDRWAGWLVGVVGGLLVLGPGLAPGALLNLDLVATDPVPVPAGVWGLGPDFPRRVPWVLPLAWGSTVLPGTVLWKVLLVALLAVATAGATSLVRRLGAGLPASLAAGVLYGLGPFLVTRLSVGHVGPLIGAAVLPWALPRLLRPADSPARTFLWLAAAGLGGYAGATVVAVPLAVGLVRLAWEGRLGDVAWTAASAVAAQLPWLVPGLVVSSSSAAAPASAALFRPDLHGPGGVLGLLVGTGFWRRDSQVAGPGWTVTLLAAALLVVAVVGLRALPRQQGGVRRVDLLVTGAVGLGLVLAASLPGIRRPVRWLSDTSVGLVLREPHRLLCLALLVVAVGVALGADELGRRLRAASSARPEGRTTPAAEAIVAVGAVLVLVLLTVVPGWWGADGALEPVRLSSAWGRAERAVDARPGAVLALPFYRYVPLYARHDRAVLNPAPFLLGGDVLVSSDPGRGTGSERADAREPFIGPIEQLALTGQPVGPALARLGIRWVLLEHEVEWRSYRGLRRDPTLRRRVVGSGLELFEVRDWRGPAVTADGRSVAVRPVVAPLARVASGGALRWYQAPSPGWRRWSGGAASVLPGGALHLPAGGGILWYPPALVVLLADAAWLIAVGASLVALRGGEPSEPSPPSDSSSGLLTPSTSVQ